MARPTGRAITPHRKITAVKINDIRADGTVYWYDTRQDWGTWLTPDYDRGPVKRIDAKRYTMTGPSWSARREGREDPKGRYGAFNKVNEDGTPTDDARVYYLQSTHIRDTMVNVRARYDRQKEADAATEQLRAQKAAQCKAKAEELTERLNALGIEGISVVGTDGRGYRASGPRVRVEILDGHKPGEVARFDPVATLTALLDRLEAAEADAKAYRDEADDSARGSRGYAVGGPMNSDGTYATWGLPNDRQPENGPWRP